MVATLRQLMECETGGINMGDESLRNLKVDIYKNLHNGLWSIRSRANGRVIAHVEECAVRNAQFVVQPAGRKRVLEERRKNVHAFVRGDLLVAGEKFIGIESPQLRKESITYNPYAHETFVRRNDNSPIHEAPYAALDMTGVRAYA